MKYIVLYYTLLCFIKEMESISFVFYTIFIGVREISSKVIKTVHLLQKLHVFSQYFFIV